MIIGSLRGEHANLETQKRLRNLLDKFIGDNEEMIFVVDYRLNNYSLETSGLIFYEMFAEGKQTIFILSRDPDDLQKVELFCERNTSCSFLYEDPYFNEKLTKYLLNYDFSLK